ncbi:hypothetical protein [Litchfieldia alkalitelluris]|uniref:hypothetical protein n=1 Tax=Litchfieldia alkalitelluris TaxID=304268 RepID=UPI000997CE91|nr:hypothetical protein [Litchfieldia alkalitelluris]
MRKRFMYISTIAIAGLFAIFLFSNKDQTEESIIFFPLDQSVLFTVASTTLTLIDEKDADEHILEWDSTSELDREVYLRQDLSLLFADGRLKAKTSEWEDNSKKIAQYTKITGEDSSHYVAVSYHHGEIHYDDQSKITSTQKMSSDYLYVIDSSFSPLESFREPKKSTHKEWKHVLDHATEQNREFTVDKLVTHFNINRDDYNILPLSHIANFNDATLFNMSKETSQQTIGKLWEGLYKNYFLGIKLEDGTIVDPIGSSEPHLFFHKDLSHILILFETSEGTPVQLIQNLPTDR